MQITIVQSEIEEAIRNHVLQQMNVEEGMEMRIDLRATRGANGYQAMIDVRPEGGFDNEPEAPVRQPRAAKPARDPNAPPKKRGRPSKAEIAAREAAAAAAAGGTGEAEQNTTQEAPVVAQETQPETQATVQTEAPIAEAQEASETVSENQTETSTETQADPVVAAIEQAEAAPAPRRSIFGGLTAPVNETASS